MNSHQQRVVLKMLRKCYAILMDQLQSDNHQNIALLLAEYDLDLYHVHRMLNPDNFEKELLKPTE